MGKKILATTNCDALNGFNDCYQSLAPGTIASYVGPHSITVNAAPMLANTVTTNPITVNFTGWFLWGHDDGAQIASAWANAVALNLDVNLPLAETMFIGTPPFLSTSLGGVYSPSISGGAGACTVLVPTADYNYSAASAGLFFSYPSTNQSGWGNVQFQNSELWSHLQNFTVWGGGIDGQAVSAALPVFNATLTRFTNV